MNTPKLSCGKFLGYRIQSHGNFEIYLGCIQGIMTADLNDIIDFADNADPEMEAIYVYLADSDEPELIYHRAVNRWDNHRPNNMTKHVLTYQDKMNLSGTIFCHPPRDNLKSIKLRDFLLKIGYFNIPSTTQNTTLCYEDKHIREIITFINDPDITPEQREILLRLMDEAH